MNLLLLLDPLNTLKPYKDTSVAIMRAAARRQHAVHAAGPGDLLWRDGAVWARTHVLRVSDEDAHWYDAAEPKLQPLAGFDAVLMRKDPPFDSEYLYATQLLSLAQAQGAKVFNAPDALRDFNEKLAILRFPQWIAPTLVSRSMNELKAFASQYGDVIFKPLDGMGGMEVFRVREDGLNLNAILETLTRQESRTIMAQRYLPQIRDGDKRVLLIDGEVVPWALARMAAEGETRANLAAGGRGVAQPLDAREREIAEGLAPQLRAAGLLLVGLDMIGGWLTEINVTSPTGLVEIFAQSGCDAAAMVVDALERRCA